MTIRQALAMSATSRTPTAPPQMAESACASRTSLAGLPTRRRTKRSTRRTANCPRCTRGWRSHPTTATAPAGTFAARDYCCWARWLPSLAPLSPAWLACTSAQLFWRSGETCAMRRTAASRKGRRPGGRCTKLPLLATLATIPRVQGTARLRLPGMTTQWCNRHGSTCPRCTGGSRRKPSGPTGPIRRTARPPRDASCPQRFSSALKPCRRTGAVSTTE
mmetsp:Transcript_147272/g.410240  ORF Transcript_147272/g.410240 Transcript_147272/m.410240 type:complete len:219 (+) Transcript_147272:259-915(+)